MPPHSIEIIAYGGLDEEIAEAIFKRKAAGIATYGNTSVAVLSASGKTYDINFSRPTPVPIWVKIYNLVTNNNFPVDGKSQIQQRIVDFVGGDVKSGLGIGQTVICVALPTEVFKVPGVVDFDLQISTDGKTYSWNNIEIASHEKATTEESKVSVL